MFADLSASCICRVPSESWLNTIVAYFFWVTDVCVRSKLKARISNVDIGTTQAFPFEKLVQK